MTLSTRSLLAATAALALAGPALAADQTWLGGDGTWDNATANWSGGTFVNGDNAIFNFVQDPTTIDVAAGVTVADLTLASGVGRHNLRGQFDNDILSVAANATWDVGDSRLAIVADQINDLGVSVASGTWTITGVSGGAFDTGEKPNGADWVAAGVTLDVIAPIFVRGHNGSIGQFDLVRLADGVTYVHERNQAQTYGNNWELVSGTAAFQNRFNRDIILGGVVSGAGALRVQDMGGNRLVLNNVSNTFTGGVIVDSGLTRSELRVNNDAAFGAVPGSFDADNITLTNFGELKMDGVTINANRGITLIDGGIIVNTSNANTYGGTITGNGGLQIGRDAGSDGNLLILTSDTHDYTGETVLYQGGIQLGIDNALPNTTVLRIGGKGTSRFEMQGFDQTLGGLALQGANTRVVRNYGETDSTLTLNVAEGESYSYSSNIDDGTGAGVLNIVKTGLGIQTLNRTSAYASFQGVVTVNEGELRLNTGFINSTGKIFTANGGTMTINGTVGADLQINDGATLAGDSEVTGSVTLASGATLFQGKENVRTLTVGSLTMADGTIFEYDIDFASAFDGAQQIVGDPGNANLGNDLVAVNGDLVLDGILNVTELTDDPLTTEVIERSEGEVINASIGTTFRLMTYTGTLTDNGLELGTVPTLGAGLGFEIDTSVLGQINLVVAASSLVPGDADGDGDVDDTDLGIAISNFTGPVGAAGNKTLAQGDTDGDGDVDDTDLGVMISGFTGPLAPAAAAVPEPTSLALLGLGGLAVLRRRRKQ